MFEANFCKHKKFGVAAFEFHPWRLPRLSPIASTPATNYINGKNWRHSIKLLRWLKKLMWRQKTFVRVPTRHAVFSAFC